MKPANPADPTHSRMDQQTDRHDLPDVPEQQPTTGRESVGLLQLASPGTFLQIVLGTLAAAVFGGHHVRNGSPESQVEGLPQEQGLEPARFAVQGLTAGS